MDENLTFFADAVGACERILKTPIPLSYTRCDALTHMSVMVPARCAYPCCCTHGETR